MAEESLVQDAVGVNAFLEGEALVDVLSRLGFEPSHARLLVSWWDWMDPCPFMPDDLASAIMMALPPETAKAADKRRSECRMGLIPSAFRHNANRRRM